MNDMTPVTEKVTVYSLARQYLKKAKNDTKKASALMIAAIMKDKAITAMIVADAIEVASKTAINSAIVNQRSNIMRIASSDFQRPPAPDNIERNKAMAESFARSMSGLLLDFPLRGGMLLRNATTVEIDITAEAYEKNSQTEAFRGRWLRMIQKRLPAGQRVGHVMTEDDLNLIHEEAKNAG